MHLRKRPDNDILEDLFTAELKTSRKFYNIMNLYEQHCMTGTMNKSYEYLYNMLIRFLDDRRKKHVNNELLRSSASALSIIQAADKHHNRTTKESVRRPRTGDCHSWMTKGECSRGTSCPWAASHTPEKRGIRRGRQYRPSSRTGSRASSSEPRHSSRHSSLRSGSGSRKSQSPSMAQHQTKCPTKGTSPSGRKDSRLCRDYLEHRCTRGKLCNFYHPKLCNEFESTGKCSRGENCGFFHNFHRKTARKSSGSPRPNAAPARETRVSPRRPSPRNSPRGSQRGNSPRGSQRGSSPRGSQRGRKSPAASPRRSHSSRSRSSSSSSKTSSDTRKRRQQRRDDRSRKTHQKSRDDPKRGKKGFR